MKNKAEKLTPAARRLFAAWGALDPRIKEWLRPGFERLARR